MQLHSTELYRWDTSDCQSAHFSPCKKGCGDKWQDEGKDGAKSGKFPESTMSGSEEGGGGGSDAPFCE